LRPFVEFWQVNCDKLHQAQEELLHFLCNRLVGVWCGNQNLGIWYL